MRLLLAGIALLAGVVVLLSLLWKPQRVAARPYVEDDDGVQPVDPRPDVLVVRDDRVIDSWGVVRHVLTDTIHTPDYPCDECEAWRSLGTVPWSA